MGNLVSQRRKIYPDLKPSAPVVTLAEDPVVRKKVNHAAEKKTAEAITEEVRLHWKPPKQCKKSSILGYKIEMWDLSSHSWVEVTMSSSPLPTCVLSNILSGMLYQFRVTALTSHGKSEPSDPSEAFIVDIPDVNIAPYWVNTLPPKLTPLLHSDLVLRAEALGTPKPSIHWYKDEDEVFITDGVHITEMEFGNELRIENLNIHDAGIFRCSAINTIGKCVAETEVTIGAKPEFLYPPVDPVKFREEEMVRLKFQVVAIPQPEIQVKFGGKKDSSSAAFLSESELEEAQFGGGAILKLKDDHIMFQINSAQREHEGAWTVRAENSFGVTEMTWILELEEPPAHPGMPEVESHEDSVTLRWDPPAVMDPQDKKPIYHIEYYRDQWQLWLKGSTCSNTHCVLQDLVPGSYYKFRVRIHTRFGLSDPSPESELVLIGTPPEDELFGLPGGNYPKTLLSSSSSAAAASGVHRRKGSRHQRHHSSSLLGLDHHHHQQEEPSTTKDQQQQEQEQHRPPLTSLKSPLNQQHLLRSGRQFSLEREVYYSNKNGERREVVTYSKPPNLVTNQLGSSQALTKYNMSQEELGVYKQSMSDLCRMLNRISQSNLNMKQQQEQQQPTEDDGGFHPPPPVAPPRRGSQGVSIS